MTLCKQAAQRCKEAEDNHLKTPCAGFLLEQIAAFSTLTGYTKCTLLISAY